MTTTTRATYAQSDREILAALAAPEGWRLDRAETFRVHVLDADGQTLGLANIDDETHRWYLACQGCECALEPGDGRYCPTCTMILVAEGVQ